MLDFWVELGWVYQIESANKFVVCEDEHRDHIHALQHFTSCQKIEEHLKISRLMKMPPSSTFKVHKNHVIEIQGRCGNCRIHSQNRFHSLMRPNKTGIHVARKTL